MLTENRKRQRSGGDEESSHLVPQAKRPSRGHPLSPEPGRDAWDSESSNSESSSSISSPEHAAGSCSSRCAVGPCSPLSTSDSSELASSTHPVSYQQINRILKQAHFQSLQSRGHIRDTWQPQVTRQRTSFRASHAGSPHSALPTHLQLLWNLTAQQICGWRPALGQVSGGVHHSEIQNDNRFSNNNRVISVSLFCDPLGVWPVWFTCCSQSHFVTEWLLMTMMNPCCFCLKCLTVLLQL